MKLLFLLFLAIPLGIYALSGGLLGRDTRSKMPKLVGGVFSIALGFLTLVANWDSALTALHKRGLISDRWIEQPSPSSGTNQTSTGSADRKWNAVLGGDFDMLASRTGLSEGAVQVGCIPDVGYTLHLVLSGIKQGKYPNNAWGELLKDGQVVNGSKLTIEFAFNTGKSFFVEMEALNVAGDERIDALAAGPSIAKSSRENAMIASIVRELHNPQNSLTVRLNQLVFLYRHSTAGFGDISREIRFVETCGLDAIN